MFKLNLKNPQTSNGFQTSGYSGWFHKPYLSYTLPNKHSHIDHLLSTSPAVIYSRKIDIDFPFTFISDNIHMHLGYTSATFLKQHNFWKEHIHPQDREYALKEMDVVLEDHYATFEYRFLGFDGKYHWLHDRARLITNEEGVPIEIVGSCIDITHTKEIEENFRQTNAFLDSIIENIPNMIFIKDARDLRFVRFNKAGENLLGFPRDALLGKNDYDFFPKEEADQFTEKDRLVLNNKDLVDIPEEPIHTKNLGTRFLHTKKIPLLDTQGNPEYLLGISEDITDKKRNEERLREIHDIQKQVLNAMHDMIIVKGADSKIIWGNTAFHNYCKLSREELLTLPVNAKELKQFSKEDDNVFQEKHVVHVPEESLKRHDDKFRSFTTIKTPILNAQGDVAMTISVYHDITDHLNTKRKERDLQAQLMQHEKLASIGLLAAGVAHELNNPLTGLLSLMRTYRKRNQNNNIDDNNELSDMLEAANHMAQIIEDLNSFSRASSKKSSLIDINRLIEATLNFSQYQLINSNIRVIKSYASDLPEIRGNKSEIQQVIVNLLTNARDAIRRDGTLTIQTTYNKDKSSISIQFIDTGKGINQEDLSHIFDPFFTTKPIGEGMGLGLSVIHGIVKNHKGTINITSQITEGTIVRVELPTNT